MDFSFLWNNTGGVKKLSQRHSCLKARANDNQICRYIMNYLGVFEVKQICFSVNQESVYTVTVDYALVTPCSSLFNYSKVAFSSHSL